MKALKALKTAGAIIVGIVVSTALALGMAWAYGHDLLPKARDWEKEAFELCKSIMTRDAPTAMVPELLSEVFGDEHDGWMVQGDVFVDGRTGRYTCEVETKGDDLVGKITNVQEK